MPLEPITADTAELAKNAARQIISQIQQTSANIVKLRANGIPAVPARAAQTLPDGRVIPAQDARPAVSGADIDTALGTANVAVLDALAAALA